MRAKMVWRMLGALVALALLLIGLDGTATAAPLIASGPGVAAQGCETTTNNTFSGRVTKAGSPLTVRATDERDRTVTAGPNLAVIRDGANAAFADLREGDQVNVTVPAGSAECVATRIEATSNAAPVAEARGFNPLWLLPLLLLPLLLLPFLLRRRRPAPQVTRTERVVESRPTPPAVTSERVVRPEMEAVVERTNGNGARDGRVVIESDDLADEEVTRTPRR